MKKILFALFLILVFASGFIAHALFPFGSTFPSVTLPSTAKNGGDIEKGAGCFGQAYGEILSAGAPTNGTIRFNCGNSPAIIVTINGTYLTTHPYLDTNLTGTGYQEIKLVPYATGSCTLPASDIGAFYYTKTSLTITFTPNGSATTLPAGNYDYCASYNGSPGQVLPTFSIDWYS